MSEVIKNGYIGEAPALDALRLLDSSLEQSRGVLDSNGLHLLRFMLNCSSRSLVIADNNSPEVLRQLYTDWEMCSEGYHFDSENGVERNVDYVNSNGKRYWLEMVLPPDEEHLHVAVYGEKHLDEAYVVHVLRTGLESAHYDEPEVIQIGDLVNPKNYSGYYNSLNRNLAMLSAIIWKDQNGDQELSPEELEFGIKFGIFDTKVNLGAILPEYVELSAQFNIDYVDALIVGEATKYLSDAGEAGATFADIRRYVNSRFKEMGIPAISPQKLSGIIYLLHPQSSVDIRDPLVVRNEGGLCIKKDSENRLIMPPVKSQEIASDGAYALPLLPCSAGHYGCALIGSCSHLGESIFTKEYDLYLRRIARVFRETRFAELSEHICRFFTDESGASGDLEKLYIKQHGSIPFEYVPPQYGRRYPQIPSAKFSDIDYTTQGLSISENGGVRRVTKVVFIKQ